MLYTLSAVQILALYDKLDLLDAERVVSYVASACPLYLRVLTAAASGATSAAIECSVCLFALPTACVPLAFVPLFE